MALPFSPIEYLYKYKSFDEAHPERTFEPMIDKKLWTASIASFNDPMEGAFFFKDAGAAAAATMFLNSGYCGCICFSSDPAQPLMWFFRKSCGLTVQECQA
jgi:hypothetical protein